MISHKEGVRLLGVQALVLHGVHVAHPIWLAYGAPELVITSGTEGFHSSGSSHYRGFAVDLRTNNLPSNKLDEAIATLKKCLGSDYYVLKEKDHVHLEWRPQDPYDIA